MTSIRGYTCKFDRLSLIRKEASDSEVYEDSIRDVGAPNKTVTENDQVLTVTKWTNNRFCITAGLTITKHRHQNYCELVDRKFKLSVLN